MVRQDLSSHEKEKAGRDPDSVRADLMSPNHADIDKNRLSMDEIHPDLRKRTEEQRKSNGHGPIVIREDGKTLKTYCSYCNKQEEGMWFHCNECHERTIFQKRAEVLKQSVVNKAADFAAHPDGFLLERLKKALWDLAEHEATKPRGYPET